MTVAGINDIDNCFNVNVNENVRQDGTKESNRDERRPANDIVSDQKENTVPMPVQVPMSYLEPNAEGNTSSAGAQVNSHHQSTFDNNIIYPQSVHHNQTLSGTPPGQVPSIMSGTLHPQQPVTPLQLVLPQQQVIPQAQILTQQMVAAQQQIAAAQLAVAAQQAAAQQQVAAAQLAAAAQQAAAQQQVAASQQQASEQHQVAPLSNDATSILSQQSNVMQTLCGNVQGNAQQQPQLQLPQLPQPSQLPISPVYNGVNPAYPGLRVLNQYPPIFAVDSFLTPPECDFLISAAQDSFSPAPVVGKGAGEVSPSRTSTTCYLAREDLPLYMEKICALTGKPVEHCELPQVGRYLPSQQYLQHYDAFDLTNEDGMRFMSNGGQRTVTVLVYLNDVEKGGGTAFPMLNLEVRPKRGMAIVFFPASLDGLLDEMTLHAAKPAVDTKYVSQVWIRQGNYSGLPSKRMFSSVEEATIVQKSLIFGANNGMTNVGLSPNHNIHSSYSSNPTMSGQ